MGYNTNQWDKESHYAKKTTKQLEDELTKFREGLEKVRDNDPLCAASFYSNHIEYLRMKIAERIGK